MQIARQLFEPCGRCGPHLGLSGSLPGERALAENSLSGPRTGSSPSIASTWPASISATFASPRRSAATLTRCAAKDASPILRGLIYDWQGTTASTGNVTSAGPEPAMYALNYQRRQRRPGSSA